MTDSIHTIFQKLIDRLSTIPKKHLDVVIAQLETTKSEINELLSNAPTAVKKASTASKAVKKAPTKKAKDVKDANAVKKPLSSYMLFCKDRRSVITAENVGIAPRDVLKKLGEVWKALSADEKSVYTEKASEDKRRYEEDTKGTNDSKGTNMKKTKNLTAKTVKTESDPVDDVKEKKKSSPYIRFCNEKRASVKESHPDMDAKTIVKTIGAMWRALSEEEQQSYKTM
jgi:hypothetical protein